MDANTGDSARSQERILSKMNSMNSKVSSMCSMSRKMDIPWTLPYRDFFLLPSVERTQWVLVKNDPDHLKMTIRPRRKGEPPTDWSRPQ